MRLFKNFDIMALLVLFLVLTVGAVPSLASVRYVAVVETEIDMEPTDVAKLKKSEVRLITEEIRNKSVNILPRDKYSIMTSETVQSMSGAILEECSEENCIITLGSKIGADYIVRGKLGKFQTFYTLSIVIYDTDNGFLVASSNSVRSEKMIDLLEKSSEACENLFKRFMEIPVPVPTHSTIVEPVSESVTTIAPNRTDESVQITNTDKRRDTIYVQTTSWANKIDWYIAPKYQFKYGTPVSWGGSI